MITQMGHTAYRVKDVNASLDFYAKLGLNEGFRLNKPDGSLWIVFVRINDYQRIELFPGGSQAVKVTDDSVIYDHFSLLVDDLETTVAELKAKGVTIVHPLRKGEDGNLQAWLADPDGNRIELMQILPGSLR